MARIGGFSVSGDRCLVAASCLQLDAHTIKPMLDLSSGFLSSYAWLFSMRLPERQAISRRGLGAACDVQSGFG